MTKMWSGLQELWQRHPLGSFTVTYILDQAVIPALVSASSWASPRVNRASPDAILDSYNLIAASWDSLGRPNLATGLAIPLVRLARLMASAGAVFPKWLTTSPRANRLIWCANACVAISEDHVSWDFIGEAAQLTESRYFHLLHLYTVFISQSIAHFPTPPPYPVKRHEVMSLVVDRCCLKIGGNGYAWKGRPSNELKDTLVGVYEELRRYQLDKGKISLRGHDGEGVLVRGIWALAGWSSGKDAT